MSPNGFTVYIDESGDDGFHTNADGTGSSRWFVLTAIVIRNKNDALLRQCLAKVRATLGKPPLTPLHFRDLKYDPRRAYLTELATLPIRIVSVVAHKFAHPENPFVEKDQFYRYITRLLVERVSWLCRDHSAPADGAAELIFSNRGSMSYQEVSNYLGLLKSKPADQVKIDWTFIDPQKIKSVAHDKLAGLQAVDAAAYSSYALVYQNKFNLNDTTYASILLPRFYRHKGTALWNYGIKWWPDSFEKTIAANPYLKGLAAWK